MHNKLTQCKGTKVANALYRCYLVKSRQESF